jgi:hypothetical protein
VIEYQIRDMKICLSNILSTIKLIRHVYLNTELDLLFEYSMDNISSNIIKNIVNNWNSEPLKIISIKDYVF